MATEENDTATDQADVDAAAAAAAAGGAGGETILTADQKEADEAKAEDTAEGEDGDEAGDDADKSDSEGDEPELVTADTEFELPDGTEVAEEDMAAFKGLSEELGLSKDQAQKLLTMEANRVAAMSQAAADAAVKQANDWAEQSRADKEFGGDDFAANAAIANEAMNKFAGEDVVEIMNTSGLGNHPGMIRMFLAIGRATGSDKFVGGGTGGGEPTDPETRAQRFYDVNKTA